MEEGEGEHGRGGNVVVDEGENRGRGEEGGKVVGGEKEVGDEKEVGEEGGEEAAEQRW